MGSYSLQVQNLCKRYGSRRVFGDLCFSHSQGVLGIGGPNGSGKSTLLQCLAGLERPGSGDVEWKQNEKPIEIASLKKHLGYAAPYLNLYDELSCGENLRFLLKLRGMKHKEAIINKWLEKTGIGLLAKQPFGRLSTGQKQRLRLAAALVHHPKILFLDEPGSNLDASGHALIKQIVIDFKTSDKLAFIASNNEEELALCDRVFSVEEEKFVKE